MPTCHKCPHEADVRAGRYDGVNFEKAPCFGCRFTGDQPNKHGFIHVSAELMPANELESAWTASRPESDADTVPEEVRAFFVAWLRLPGYQRDAFAWRMAHPEKTFSDLAEERGHSVAAVHAAYRKAEASLMRTTGVRYMTRRAAARKRRTEATP